jgi:GTP-binding protein HflX
MLIPNVDMRRAVIFTITEDTEEMRALLETLEVSVVSVYLQRRSQPHARSYLGPGKIDEIADELKGSDCNLIIINGDLKPSQHHFLEMKFQKECMDRTGVILGIFSMHAHTPEAIAQVTLAKLRYEQPFLREWIHKAKKGDRPGFLAGGAYAVDAYYEHARRQARRIEQRLRDLSEQRTVTRRERRSAGYSLVSLAGYTNAGKSALFNRLAGASVDVNDRLFSTLATTTRRVSGLQGTVLISDTVGFIKDLPPDLIDAFNSTLEEIYQSDMIVVVVDVSESLKMIEAKLKTSMEILSPRVPDRQIIVVGSKVDRIDTETRARVDEALKNLVDSQGIVYTSSLTGEGLDILLRRITPVMGRTYEMFVTLPLSNEALSLLSRVRSIAYVSNSISSNSIEASLRCKPEDRERISGWIRAIGGFVSRERVHRQEE